MPCNCSMCNGTFRDHRTVQRHQAAEATIASEIGCDSSTRETSFSGYDQFNDDSDNEFVVDEDDISKEDDAQFVVPEDRITNYVLGELHTKLVYGYSQSQLEEHLANANGLIGSVQLPRTYQQVMSLLRSLGYKEPKHMKVCINDEHHFLLEDKDKHPSCPVCLKPWKECIDYYVLGLQFANWFLTEENCQKCLAHWNAQDEWFNLPHDHQPELYSEIWHGSRFRDLSYFWDSNHETLLPHKCPLCAHIIPASDISDLSDPFHSLELITMKCSSCAHEFKFTPDWMRGDPRNQAIIVHYDGWNPNNTSSRNSIASITITPACVSKQKRSLSENSFVYSFVPVSRLPSKYPHKYDAFLKPLIEEVEDLYINGEEVFFKSGIPNVSPPEDFALLRMLILLVTADSRGHSEIGLTCAGGLHGCRRCKVAGKYVAERRHYYFGDFNERCYVAAEKRDAEENRQFGKHVDSAGSYADRCRRSKETGVTGETIFFRLYDLYGFDPIKDLVIDAMHAVVLNLLRRELEDHIFCDMGPNASLAIEDRDPTSGGVLRRNDLITALSKVNWTTELRDGRIPTLNPDPSSGSKLGNWKAEEFSKFAAIAPVVLVDIVPRRVYSCFMLIVKIHNLVLSHYLRSTGWQPEHITYLKDLLWLHAIEYEELYGLSACTENVEYSLHLPEDIVRHSIPDNYWCYVYERLVKCYKRQTTNMKNVAKTFITRAAQVRFVTRYLSTHRMQRRETASDDIDTYPLKCSTIDAANALYSKLTETCVPALKQMGILIGGDTLVTLSPRQLRDIKHWVQEVSDDILSEESFPQVGLVFSKIIVPNEIDVPTVYRNGDIVAIKDPYASDSEWIIEIKCIVLYGPIDRKYFTFVDGEYYVPQAARSGVLLVESWSQQPKLYKRSYANLCVQKAALIERKIMLYPDPHNRDRPSFFLAVDTEGFIQPITVTIPTL